MEKINFKGKRVTVMGIGLHGGAIDLIKWLLKEGAKVTATDIKTEKELTGSIEKLKGLKNLQINIGQHRPENFEKADLVIKNPAVAWDNKYVQIALKNKVPVEMDSSLFFKLCPSKKIIGITGTKGKTTTATLIAEILRQAGKKVVSVGIGQQAVLGKLKDIDKETYVVFELSSWRLSALKNVEKSAQIAVITNILPDHLNYYKNMEDYADDKRVVFKHQKADDFLIYNLSNADWIKPEDAKSRKICFSLEKITADDCVYMEGGKILYNIGEASGEICDVKKIRLKGCHNLSNILAASAAAISCGISPRQVEQTVTNFSGIAHRLEFVLEMNKVKFYNDTAATTPDSAVAAVNSFMVPINLICGGSSKNLDYDLLGRKIAQSKFVKNIFLLKGTATEQVKKSIEKFSGAEKIKGVFDNIDSAAASAWREARQGEVILLSPGCASFGMFENEFDRGDKFKTAVKKLKEESLG